MTSQPSVATDSDLYPSRRKSTAQLLGRQDPVVHASGDVESPIPKDLVEQYERDGFLVIERLFDAEEVLVLRRELDRLRAERASLDAESVIIEPESNAVRSIFKAHRVSPIFERLARDARLVNIAQYLLGGDVYLHQTRLNYKPGFVGKAFYWHSDFETWHVEDGMPRMRALSVSVTLTENTPNNGPLMLVPGSHRTYVTCVGETPEDHYKDSLRKQEVGVPDPDSLSKLVDKGGIEAVTGPAGTVIFFECNTMHGSNSNITPLPRANAFFVYNSVHNRVEAPFGPQTPRPDFLAEREDFTPIVAQQGSIQ